MPIYDKIHEIEEQILDQKAKIQTTKSQILKNDSIIRDLLMSVVTTKWVMIKNPFIRFYLQLISDVWSHDLCASRWEKSIRCSLLGYRGGNRAMRCFDKAGGRSNSTFHVYSLKWPNFWDSSRVIIDTRRGYNVPVRFRKGYRHIHTLFMFAYPK